MASSNETVLQPCRLFVFLSTSSAKTVCSSVPVFYPPPESKSKQQQDSDDRLSPWLSLTLRPLEYQSFLLPTFRLNSQKNLSDSLTLVYLPRINEKALDVDGSKIRSDSPAFVSLHRVLAAAKAKNGDAIFGSRERVRASEGIQFEVYLGEAKILKGIFRRDEDDEWKLECKCELVGDLVGDDGCKVSEAEVCVAVEGQGHVSMSEKVAMVVKKKKKHRKGFNLKGLELEEIPEEREVDTESLSDDCCCSSSCGGDSDITGSDAAGMR
ncbi:NADP-specific glutamate dehydrogenase [Quillaja saponaria]|uniref:NADP-specific glutamate dehydrogenase n=1 Tax=Quillaja saponaria TaxID=32244 RepID=A0AAD7KSX9_QUISA|nr:NADP-specific glutamate dehydrogenase [Quillaja saponaria]